MQSPALQCATQIAYVRRRVTWWRHQMGTFSALLAICAGNSPVTGEFPSQRPVTRSVDVFFDLRLNKRISKQSRSWWFETPPHSLWRHCNEKSRCCNLDQGWVHLCNFNSTWLCYVMMTSSNGNTFRVTGHLCGEFTGPRWIPTQRPVTRSFDAFFDLCLNKRLSKHWWGWWFETLSRPLWPHRNVIVQLVLSLYIRYHSCEITCQKDYDLGIRLNIRLESPRENRGPSHRDIRCHYSKISKFVKF